MKCGSVLLIRTFKKSRTWSVSRSTVKCTLGSRLCVSVIEEKGSIFRTVEKTKCVIHVATIE